MKLLLTGSTGFLGSALKRKLNNNKLVLTSRSLDYSDESLFFKKNISKDEDFSDCLKNIEVDDQKINKEAFLKDRKVVLEQWKTGREAKSIEENAEFLSKQKNFSNLQSKVNKNIKPIDHNIGVLNSTEPPHIVAIHEKIFIPVGTAITIVASIKYACCVTDIPTVYI